METQSKLSLMSWIADRLKLLLAAVACCGMIVMACGAILFGLMIYALGIAPNRGSAAEKACALARLAPVPGKILQEENRHNMFAGSSYVYFRATEAEIKKWIDASPGLKAAKVINYTKDYVLASVPGYSHEYDASAEHVVTHVPWFLPASKNGAKYEVPSDDHANYGTVYVDWDTGTVWISASHS